MKEVNPLDLEQHEEETVWDVWKRRLMFILLIALCIAFAAPTFASCTGAFEGGGPAAATYRIGDKTFSIDELSWSRLQRRVSLTNWIRSRQRSNDDEETYWRHLLLDAAGREAGIHVPDAVITRILANVPDFQKDGQFHDATYRQSLAQASRGDLSHKDFMQTMREGLRGDAYARLYITAMGTVSAREAYDTWRTENEKLSVEFVALDFAALEDEVADVEPTDEQLLLFKQLPTIEAELRLPARKVVEAAYMHVREVTEAQAAEIETLLRESDVLSADEDLDSLAVQVCFDGRDTIFTRSNWLAQAHKRYELALAVHKAKKEAFDKGESPDDPGDPPPDPADSAWPEKFLDRFNKFWREPLRREVLARMLTEYVAQRSEQTGKSFADLAAEQFEIYGLRVARNETPLTAADIADAFPAGLGKNSEFGTTVLTHLRGPAVGKPFVPQVYSHAVPTTALGHDLDARGYMVLRLAEFEPPRARELDEARDEIVVMWRKHRVRELAKERLDAVKAAMSDGDKTLADAAAEHGLTVASLRRFNSDTSERREPKPKAGESLAPDVAAAAAGIRHRNRVIRDHEGLKRLEIDAFRSVLVDEESKAAYLVRLVEKHEPLPIEMGDNQKMVAQMQLRSEAFKQIQDLLSLDALKKRFQLEIMDRNQAPEDEDADENKDDDDTADGDS